MSNVLSTFKNNIGQPAGSDSHSAAIHKQIKAGIVSKQSKKHSINNKHFDHYCQNPMTPQNIDLSVGN